MSEIVGAASSTGWKLKILYTIQQSVSENTSTLRLKLQIYDGTGLSYNLDEGSCYFILQGGDEVYHPYKYSSKGWYDLGEKTITKKHAADGTASVTLSAEWHSGFSSQWTPSTLTVTGTVALPTIKRLSALSAPSTMTMGQEAELTVTRQRSAYSHKIDLLWYGSTVAVAAKTTSTSLTFTPALRLAEKIPDAASGTGTLKLTTYDGNTALGSQSYSVKLRVPSSMKPSVTVVLGDETTDLATYGAYVQSHSTIRATITGSGQRGATLKTAMLQLATPGGTFGGPSGQTWTSFADGQAVCQLTPPVSGSLRWRVSVTDSRGMEAEKSGTLSVLPYQAPGIPTITAVRCDTDGTENPAGSSALVCFTGAVSSLNEQNAASYAVKYRPQGQTSWTTQNLLELAGTYAPSGKVIVPASPDLVYEVCARATDSFGSGESLVVTLPSARALFHIAPGVDGLSIGQYPVKSGALIVGGIIQRVELPEKDKVTFGGKRFPAPPSLTTAQKAALVALYNDYRSIRSRFVYDYDATRDVYASAAEAVDENDLYRINCGLLCQLLWMGRSSFDFPPLVGDDTVSPPLVAGEYSRTITKAFNWGFYFPFARHAAYGLKGASGFLGMVKPNSDSDVGSYSYNSYYSPSAPASNSHQSWDTFAYAADMAEELYRMGCEVPMSEAETGDLVFFRTSSLQDGRSDLYEERAFRNISHVAMLYQFENDIPIFAEATGVTPPIIRTSLSYSSNFDKVRAANLMGRVVMVARHPAAYGRASNVPTSITAL